MVDPFSARRGDDLDDEPEDKIGGLEDDLEFEADDLGDMLIEDEFDEDGVEGEDIQAGEEARLEFSVHYTMPIPVGGPITGGLIATERPTIDAGRARRPKTPGIPPLWLPPLLAPSALKLVPPPGVRPVSAVRERTPAIAPRISFPVPDAPSFEPLSPAASRPTPEQVAQPAVAGSLLKSAPTHGEPVLPPVAPAESPAQPVAVLEETRTALRDRIDPLVPLAFYLAAIGGLDFAGAALSAEARYTILWTLLIGLGGVLTLMDVRPKPHQMASGNLAWGLIIGGIIGFPMLLLVREGLAPTVAALFPDFTLPMLFQSLVVVGPLGETLFYRGILQERRGFMASLIGSTLHNVLLFLPVAFGESSVPAVAGIFFLSVLAGVYSYVRRQYGLTAAFVCQATANLMLFFLPSVIAALGGGS